MGPNGQYETNANGDDPDNYRAGVFYLRYGNLKVGSEQIRHLFQNKLIHDNLTDSPHFKVLNKQRKFYGGYLFKKPLHIMVKFKILSIAFLIITLVSCKGCKDDEILLVREDYFGNQLNILGYYYLEREFNDIPRYNVYFLYSNGIILSAEVVYLSELEEREEEFMNGTFYQNAKDIKFLWGVFSIDNDNIEFERWYPGEKPYQTFLNKGKILNDTTFHISSFSDSDGSNTEESDELFHFKKLNPKPDSTNTFIN